MTADVRRMGPAHDEVEALLPWYVNGTLDADDHARVLSHLDACPRCRDEVAALQVFRAEYARESPAPDPAPAFARLAATLRQPALPWHRRALRRWQSTWDRASPSRQPWRWASWAVGVQLVLVAAIATVGLLLAEPERAQTYRTLSVPDATPSAPARAGSIVVRFDPATSEDELRRIVRAANARIVDGPTAADAYVLDVAGGDALAVVQALRAQRAVMLAEPLGSAR